MASHGLAGLTVAAFESRMATEMTQLIQRFGGKPLVAPSMQEIPLEQNRQALEFGRQLLAGHVNMVVFLTGVGTRTLIEVLNTRWPMDTILAALSQVPLVVRGPKPLKVVKTFGLTPQCIVPEPNTWHDLIDTLDANFPNGLSSQSIGVQEYGLSNPELLDALTSRGANVIRIPVYRWALPDDCTPLKHLINTILVQGVDVMLFTNALQIDHIWEMLQNEEEQQRFRMAMSQTVVASIGPITSTRLHSLGLPVDYEPTHPKMGILVKEVSEQAFRVLQKKQMT